MRVACRCARVALKVSARLLVQPPGSNTPVDDPLMTGAGVRDRRCSAKVGLQAASSIQQGNPAQSGRPAPPPHRDGACVRPGASSPIPHSQPLRGIVGSGCCHLMDAHWSSGRRGGAGSGWSGFTIGTMQIVGITGMGENRQRREGEAMGVVCPGGSRRRARAAFGSLSHEGQESGPGREGALRAAESREAAVA